MIVIHVSVQTPDHNVEQFKNVIRAICSEALQLDGCTKYEWYLIPDQFNNFAVYGEFDTRDHFEQYSQSDIVKRIVKEIFPLLVSRPTFKHFEATIFEQG